MRVILCALGMVLLLNADAWAQRPEWSQRRSSQSHRHSHSSDHHHRHHDRHHGGFHGSGFSSITFGLGLGSSGYFHSYSGPYYDPYYSDYYPGGYYAPGIGLWEYYLPPTYVPAEAFGFGPAAAARFYGFDSRYGAAPSALAPGVLDPPVAIPPALDPDLVLGKPAGAVDAPVVDDRAAELDVEVGRPELEPSSLQARQRARQYLRYGDALFQQQRFHQALQRYKAASRYAPDLAEPWFRQGHALVASNRFDLAFDAFTRALALTDDLSREGFQLDDLYGDSGMAKSSHLEALAGTSLERPQDPAPLFLLAITLYYDGQTDRAAKFFARAAELSADDSFLEHFLAEGPVEPLDL